MDKKRIRRAVLLLLAVLNLSLLVLVCWQELHSRRYAQQLQEQSIQYLALHGITAEQNDIPWESAAMPRSVIAAASPGDKMASGLLGGECLQSAIKSSLRYTGKNGTLTVSGNSYSAVLTGRDTSDRQADLMRCLREMGITAAASESGGAVQKVEGLPVFNCLAEYTCHEDGSVELRGRFVPGTTVADYSRSVRDSAGLLVSLASGLGAMEDSAIQITAITEGYLLESGENGEVLTPIWRVETDSGVFQLNAITGAVSVWDISL